MRLELALHRSALPIMIPQAGLLCCAIFTISHCGTANRLTFRHRRARRSTAFRETAAGERFRGSTGRRGNSRELSGLIDGDGVLQRLVDHRSSKGRLFLCPIAARKDLDFLRASHGNDVATGCRRADFSHLPLAHRRAPPVTARTCPQSLANRYRKSSGPNLDENAGQLSALGRSAVSDES